MATETNNGYLVQLQSPEGESVYPVVSEAGILDSNGNKFDLPAIKSDVQNLKTNVGGLQSEVNTAKSGISNLESKQSSMQSNLDTLNSLNLSNTQVNSFGVIPEADILHWADCQSRGGSFLVAPSITTVNMPPAGFNTYNGGYYYGELCIASTNEKVIKLTVASGDNDAGVRPTFINSTVGIDGGYRWVGWERTGMPRKCHHGAIDFSTVVEDGVYEFQGVNLNTPYGSDVDTHFILVVFTHTANAWLRQLAFDVRTNRMFSRVMTSGTWWGWAEMMVGITSTADITAGSTNLADGYVFYLYE